MSTYLLIAEDAAGASLSAWLDESIGESAPPDLPQNQSLYSLPGAPATTSTPTLTATPASTVTPTPMPTAATSTATPTATATVTNTATETGPSEETVTPASTVRPETEQRDIGGIARRLIASVERFINGVLQRILTAVAVVSVGAVLWHR